MIYENTSLEEVAKAREDALTMQRDQANCRDRIEREKDEREKDERAKCEAEREQAAKDVGTKVEDVAESSDKEGVSGVSVIQTKQLPTDEEVIDAVMQKFNLSFGQACDRILALVENMTVVA